MATDVTLLTHEEYVNNIISLEQALTEEDGGKITTYHVSLNCVELWSTPFIRVAFRRFERLADAMRSDRKPLGMPPAESNESK